MNKSERFVLLSSLYLLNTSLDLRSILQLSCSSFSPNWSARCFPFSGGTTLSSSMSHLLPTMITWALSHEYVLIWVALQHTHTHTHSNINHQLLMTGIWIKLQTNHVPVLDSVEGLLVGDVIHEDEAHGAAVVGCGDGAVTLLPRRVLETKTQTLW